MAIPNESVSSVSHAISYPGICISVSHTPKHKCPWPRCRKQGKHKVIRNDGLIIYECVGCGKKFALGPLEMPYIIDG